MAKRSTGVEKGKKKAPHKTAKRLEIKKAHLAEVASNRNRKK